MEIEKTSALLVIDIQQEEFLDMPEDLEEAAKAPRWDTILKGKRVLDVFRKKGLPVIQVKEVHREDMVDFGANLTAPKACTASKRRRIRTTPSSRTRSRASTSSASAATAPSLRRTSKFF